MHASWPRTVTQLTLTALTISLQAASTAPRPPEVGDLLPEAQLVTRNGSPFDLTTSVAGRTTVLIFYRGGWCPYCNAHLAALAGIEDDLAAIGAQLIAISPDRPSKLHDAPTRKEEPAYLLLSDQDMTLSDALGLSFIVPEKLVAKYKNSYGIDLEAAAGRTHHKLPHPAVLVVDADRVIRFVHVNPDYQHRLDPAKILEAAHRVSAR